MICFDNPEKHSTFASIKNNKTKNYGIKKQQERRNNQDY